MHLVVFPANSCWPSAKSATGYATHGGIVLQIGSLSELFEATRVVVPTSPSAKHSGEMPFKGHNISVVPLTSLPNASLWRWLALPFWLTRNGVRLIAEIATADAILVHVPGVIGTVALLFALVSRKPLLVRHIINWSEPRTFVDRFEKKLLEKYAGGKRVILATGESDEPPSGRNPNIRWIFATTISEEDLDASSLRELPRSEEVRLIIVARQEVTKGTDLVLQSLFLMRDDLPNMALDVVGDGSALPGFRKLAKDLGLAERVCFHGQVNHSEVLRLLRRAHVYCLPTVSEAFAKTVVEALACGLPVVTTAVSVFPRLIDNRCGVVLQQRTPEHLAAAIRHCLADPSRYRQMSIEATAAARRYSLERWRDTIREIVECAWGQPVGQYRSFSK
jgi:glycosyltransferase involved in cell wall biosynthesis